MVLDHRLVGCMRLPINSVAQRQHLSIRRTSARDLLILAKGVATSLLPLVIAIHVKMDLFYGHYIYRIS